MNRCQRFFSVHLLSHHTLILVFVTSALAVFAYSAKATTIVNDTWQDGTRTDPAAPVYSENGVDSDGDGDIESAWLISNNTGTTTVSQGHMISSPAAGASYFATTYFTPAASPVMLANAGDQLKVTWTFTPTNINNGTAANTSQNLPIALVQTPAASRISADASAPLTTYAGYSIFMNFSAPLGNGSPFQLREWGTTAGPGGVSGALLGTSGNWAAESPNVNGGTATNTGFVSGQQYTFQMTLTRDLTTPSSLDVSASITGGSLNGTGSESISFVDPTPNSFSYDTFAFRPASANGTAASFDTTNFRVDFTAVPEPASVVMMGFSGGALGLLVLGRSRNKIGAC
jgi:hypothetical protein